MKFVAIALLSLFAFGAVACEETTDAPSDAVATASGAAPQDDAPPAAAPSNRAKIGNLELTVNGVAPHVDRVFPAEAGTQYVAVDISAKNVGTGTYALNVNLFRLKDSEGFTSTNALTQGPEPKIGHHDMVPGQEVRGYIVFKLGAGRTATELQYQSFTGTPGTIKLQ